MNERNSVLGRRTFANSSDGFRELLRFGRRWWQREWAVEGCRGTGKNLAQRLISQGESVIDVPSRKSVAAGSA